MNPLILRFTKHPHTATFSTEHAAAYYLAWSLPFLVLLSRTSAELCVVLISGVFLFHSFQQQQWQWLKQRWLQWYFVFVAYLAFINAPLSLNSADSLLYTLFFLRWPIFAIAFAHWFAQKPQLARAFFISLVCCISFLMLDSWLQFFQGQELFGRLVYPENNTIPANRLTGPYNKPIIGIMLVRVLFIACIATLYFKQLQTPKAQFLSTISLLMAGLLTIFISGERMAFILCLFGLMTLLLGYWFSLKSIRKLITLGLTASSLILTSVAMLAPKSTERIFTNGIEKLMQFSSSDYGTVFGAAWHTWQENLWLGSGLHTFKAHCALTGVLSQSGFHCSHPHNLYLQLGTETGIIGVTLFSIMVIHLYLDLIKPHVQQRQWFIAALVFTLLNLGFWPLTGGISLLNNWVAAIVWLGIAWCIAIKKVQGPR